MMDKFTEKLTDIAAAFENNKHLMVIKNAFLGIMGFVIVGSFATLFNAVLCSTTTGLARFPALSWLANLSGMFSAINNAAMNIMAVMIAVIMGFLYGRKNKVNETTSAMVCLVSFLCISPMSIDVKVGEAVQTVGKVLPFSSVNAEGLFAAMLISILASEMFYRLTKVEAIKIKMPPQVPKNIANTFNDLVPVAVTILVIAAVGEGIRTVTGTYITNIIYKLVQIPLQKVITTPVGIVIMTFIALLFWSVGVHGNQLIASVRSPLDAAALATNIALVEAGMQATEVYTGAMWTVFITMTGSGITLSLILAILVFSKREDYRAVAKLGLVPGIFGVNEPIIFGLPIVLNPLLLVPFIFSGCLAAGVSYFAIASGFLPFNYVATPWGLPLFVNAFVAYGSWKAILVQIIILGLCFLVYTPFVKAANRVEQ